MTTRDVADFREHLRREKSQAVSTCNRCLCSIRKYLGWLFDQGNVRYNSAALVKELQRQQLAPKGLDRSQVRKLFREIELRNDVRSNAMFSVFLYCGCRVGDLVQLDLGDILMSERSGSVLFRYGKGGKQRTVPIPRPARKALQAYLEVRPPFATTKVFLGERGALTDRGVRQICDRYSAFCGFHFSPHDLRHTMAHAFLAQPGNDIVALAQLLGHSNINTTALYTRKTESDLADAADRMTY